MEHNKWLFFSKDTDISSSVTQSAMIAYPAKNLKGMAPADTTGDSRLVLSFKPAYSGISSVDVLDTITVDLPTNNTHLDAIKEIVQNINTTRRNNGGFIAVADNTVTLSSGTKEARSLDSISSCQEVQLHGISDPYVKTIAATTDGTGTGTIPAIGGWYKVTSDGDDKIVILPNISSGSEIWLDFADTTHDFELRSHAPASVSINGGTGSNAETEIAKANVLVHCIRTQTGWIVNSFAADGTETQEAAAAA